ncbi:uncharacterized protein FOMMEDRAFT_75654 [Fomitiporia mediterranea MF3/22]|uniref:uncharacterized protein n=1 Tax=Fomitiporia mediterranea (strain MF3/22) TaxID=694068 RepID=UPI00044089FA|nr:uncharacterized protein FOMMEDRAFT_75654 [Fomitiporia mediterranea MF3/22]EJD06408.1 hypothetical protein FOMMEDRAFT_75654 [Fomitiporia mediterranea MF3/22]
MSVQTSPSSRSTRKITVLYFAAALTATGVQSETIDLPSSDNEATFPLSKLGDLLVQRHLGTNLDAILQTSQWSIDAEMVDDTESVMLRGGEEVAVICPVSGG